MDRVEELVTRIAVRVAPDEVDLVPELLAASVAGQPLEDAAGVAHGAFDAAAAVSGVRVALAAVREHADLLKLLLELGSGALALVGSWQGLRRPPAAPPADEVARQTLTALDRVGGGLRAQGIAPDTARPGARELVATLLESPDAARALLARLGSA